MYKGGSNMKILIAMDSFKGSISSIDAAKAISLGIREVYENAAINAFPLADGGEGTVEALIQATKGQYVTKRVTGPLGNPIEAAYGILGDKHTAVIEVAAACGLPLVPMDKRNPLITTTHGVGELIVDAMERGCREFIIGLGGSATNDAGVGMLQALGFIFLDEHGEKIGFGGQELQRIHRIDLTQVHPLLKECTFKVACDVNNPLYGSTGAAYVFAPQKGATPEMVQQLDKGLMHFSQTVQKEMNLDIHNIDGAGAAGGLGAAFAGFLGANLQSGVGLILDTIGMEEHIRQADFVITGEGKLDGQTSMGKAPLGVAQLAKKYDVPVIALAGGTTKETSVLNELGITSYFSIISGPMSLEKAMEKEEAFYHLQVTASQLFRLIKSVQR
jgi:glycerate kinase